MNADVGFIVVQVVLHLALGLIANVYPSQPLHVTRLLVGVPVGLLLICEVFWCDNGLHTRIIIAINITAIIIIIISIVSIIIMSLWPFISRFQDVSVYRCV
jgi:hypothetical protein